MDMADKERKKEYVMVRSEDIIWVCRVGRTVYG